MEKNKKYWILGIMGCICFGIGDWLLGYVEPGIVLEQFDVLKTGHGAGYHLVKLTITLFLGAVGVPFMLIGCTKIAEIVTDNKKKDRLRFVMMLLPVGWLLIHFSVSLEIYSYSWLMHMGETDIAQEMALSTLDMLQSTQIIASLFAAVPLILLPVYTLQGKTALKKNSLWFTPLLWMALLSCLKFVVPATPFANGIDTFCMNAGMIIWFVYLLVQSGK
ncbi:MAG: hypothetical protein NC400_04020 [Clostridium sp.]|nr:hypothetical protein [Clostridium sp.]